MSPTQRSLKLLRNQGWTCQVVEHWNQYARRRIDLWGCVDILAMANGIILGVQTTSRDNTSARVKKILGLPAAQQWLECGGRLIVHGWGKGDRLPREVVIEGDMFHDRSSED